MKKTFLVSIFALILTAMPTTAHAYTDVDSTHKYYEAINYLTSLDIINGYPDDTYKPAKTLNRAELIKIIMESKFSAEMSGYEAYNCFFDVPENEWYTPHVCFAKDLGIIEGYSDGNFKPGQEINFVEAAKIILESFEYDYSESDPWFRDIVAEAAERNFIPLEMHEFSQPLSRGQMADFITRILKFENSDLDAYLGEKAKYRVSYESIEAGINAEESLELLLISDVPDPEPVSDEEPTETPPTNGDYSVFSSSTYHFSVEYPKQWYFLGSAGTDAGTLRHYAFSPEITNEEYDEEGNLISFDLASELISIDVITEQGPEGNPSGELLNIGKEYAFKVTSGEEVFIYVSDSGFHYRLSANIAYEEDLIHMATSITELQ